MTPARFGVCTLEVAIIWILLTKLLRYHSIFHALVTSMLTIMYVAKINLSLGLAHQVSLTFGTSLLLRIAGTISGTSHN